MTKINNYLDKKNSFVLYNDWYEAIEELTTEEKGLLIDAIFKYHIHNELPAKDSPIKMPFNFLKPIFDANIRSYIAKCEQNRENGLLGGRPPKKPNGLEENQTDKKKPDKIREDMIREETIRNESESENDLSKPHTHDFFNLLEKKLLLNETTNGSFVGVKHYKNKVHYFIDRNREKLEAKQDMADAILHFRNFYKQETNREAGKLYVRQLTSEQEKEICIQIFDYLKDKPEINRKGLTETGLKNMIWADRKRAKLIDYWQHQIPEKIEKHIQNTTLTDEQLNYLNK